MRTVALIALLGGCQKDATNGTGETGAPTCDDIETQPLPEVPSTEWPEGLDEAIPQYNDFTGRYEVSNSCGEGFAVKITAPPFETLQVVTKPWTTLNQRCGCVIDPAYPDDTELDPVALLDGFEIFIEEWPEPALNAQLLVGSGALYAPTSALEFRACAVDDVDPVLQSQFDQVGAIVRIPQGGGFEATLTLAPLDGGPVQTCTLTNFNLQD